MVAFRSEVDVLAGTQPYKWPKWPKNSGDEDAAGVPSLGSGVKILKPRDDFDRAHKLH